jgi:hypothetical protein
MAKIALDMQSNGPTWQIAVEASMGAPIIPLDVMWAKLPIACMHVCFTSKEANQLLESLFLSDFKNRCSTM